MKKLRAICMFLVLLLSMPFLVSADAASDAVFEQVEVNDYSVDVVNGGSVGVNRGDDVEIRVWLSSPADYDDVSLRASVEGYKYDYIEDRTRVDLTSAPKSAYLHLELPSDMDDGDYSLHLYVDGEKVGPVITLQVEKEEDLLSVQDVILRPSSTVEAGRPLAVEVRLENTGENKQEDIKVTVSIKDLGVSTRDYLDELVGVEEPDGEDETSDSLTLYLPIPVDAVTGEYDLNVDVEFDRGHEVVSTKTKVFVQGTEPAKAEVSTIISLDAVSKSVVKGGQATYRLMLANLGNSEEVYSLAVLGTEGWADVSLSPGFVRVVPNGAGELTLTVQPRAVAAAGDHSFTLRVMQGENPLRDVSLSTSVSEPRSRFGSAKNVLEVGFAVLVALLVILGLVVVFKKLGRRENEPEPIMDNGQSYY